VPSQKPKRVPEIDLRAGLLCSASVVVPCLLALSAGALLGWTGPALAQTADAGGLGLRGTTAAGPASTGVDQTSTSSMGASSSVAPADAAGTGLTPAPAGTGADSSAGDDLSPNYGRARPKKSQLYNPKSPLYTQDTRVSPPLPPLVPYPTSAMAKKPRNKTPSQQTNTRPDVIPPTVAQIPGIAAAPRLKRDEFPYAPTGVDVGSLRLYPLLDLTSGYDSNPNRLATGVKGSVYGQANAGLDVNSQWSQHSLTATLRGGYSDYLQFHEADRPNFQGKIDGRIDVTRDTQIETEVRGTLDTQQPGSQQLAIPGATFIVGRPLIQSEGATLGVSQRFDRLVVRLRGTIDRLQYQDATLNDGTLLALSENDYNDYAINAHVSYELTPGLVPYIDVTGDKRQYDSLFDSTGYERSSNGIAGKLGSTFEITRIITGDLAGGYIQRYYRDSRLNDAGGPSIDGKITWAVSPLTTVTFNTNTGFVETTLAGASGALSRSFGLQVAHQLFRNFTLTGIGTYSINSYQGQPVSEHIYGGSLLAEYNVSREIVLRASYRHERYTTNQYAGGNYTDDVFMLGVRLQR